MRTKVQKWGNSLAVRIPKPFADDLGVDQDAEVELSLEDHELVIRPVSRATYSLAELLDEVTDENLHDEVSTGDAVGAEAW
jgi:antitoxin MazE